MSVLWPHCNKQSFQDINQNIICMIRKSKRVYCAYNDVFQGSYEAKRSPRWGRTGGQVAVCRGGGDGAWHHLDRSAPLFLGSRDFHWRPLIDWPDSKGGENKLLVAVLQVWATGQ